MHLQATESGSQLSVKISIPRRAHPSAWPVKLVAQESCALPPIVVLKSGLVTLSHRMFSDVLSSAEYGSASPTYRATFSWLP